MLKASNPEDPQGENVLVVISHCQKFVLQEKLVIAINRKVKDGVIQLK